jgi:hypothetical protein
MQGSTNRSIVVQAGPGINVRPYSKITKAKNAWGYDSSGTALARQVQDPEFKLQYHQKFFF